MLLRHAAPCFSLISDSREIEEMPVLQGFLAFLAARSLFFSKITLILAKYQGDGFVSDCAHHQPSLASQATARQASLNSIVAKQAKAAAPKPFGEGGLHRWSSFASYG